MIKVSVVIPTYRPGDGLNRLVRSLDAQTMPTDEFEIIFVDDGSPDDTYPRLQQIAAERPNVRVERIENSGWPCRPRNIGTDIAHGEYVAYMDHDDELYPDALRAGYSYAKANDADVLTGKESRTHKSGWAISTYEFDMPQSVGREDQHPLVPMNPHKLYRREFLREHDIRFIEGGRVMWEDIFFNVLVARHAEVISTLATVPYYHWVSTTGSGSTAFRRENPEYWMWMRRVIETTDTELAAQPLAHRQLMTHHYRGRVIASFGAGFAKHSAAERDKIYRECLTLQSDFNLSRFDAGLNKSGQLRAYLLRQDERALLERLPAADPSIPGGGTATVLEWRDRSLHVTADVDWVTSKGHRHALRREGDRIMKALPEEIVAAVPAELRDVTDEIAAATIRLGMRNRGTRVVWMLPSQSSVRAEDAADGSVRITGTVAAQIDPSTAAAGRRLGRARWDLNVRADLGGSTSQTALRSKAQSSAAIYDGVVHLAYVNESDIVTVVVGAPAEVVTRFAPTGAVHEDADDIVIPLDGRHGGEGRIPVTIRAVDAEPLQATLHIVDGRARLSLPRPPASVRLRIGERSASRNVHWELNSPPGAPTLIPVKSETPKRPKPELRARVRRAIGALLRRLGLRR